MLERKKEMEHLRRLAETLRQALTDATTPAPTGAKRPAPIVKADRGDKQPVSHGRQRFTRSAD